MWYTSHNPSGPYSAFFQLVLFQGHQAATQHYFNCFMLLAAINVLHKNIDIVSAAFKAKKSVYSYNLHSFLNGFGGWEHITQPAYVGMHLFKWTWIIKKNIGYIFYGKNAYRTLSTLI